MPKRGPKPRLVGKAPHAAPRGSWEPPAHLTGEAEEAWNHVVALLAEAGNLGRTDPSLVEGYAINRALLRAAHQAIQDRGLIVTNGMGAPAANPACAVVNAATLRLKSIINDLGLCPASARYAAVSSGEAKPDDPWGDLLSITG